MNPVVLSLCSLSQGERVTWEKLAAIRANCGIELTIDSCLAQLTNDAKQQRVLQSKVARNSLRNPQSAQSQFLRARTPSWINLQAYGQTLFAQLQDSTMHAWTGEGACISHNMDKKRLLRVPHLALSVSFKLWLESQSNYGMRATARV